MWRDSESLRWKESVCGGSRRSAKRREEEWEVGSGKKKGKNYICEGLSKRNRVTVRLCGGASRERIGSCDRGG